jgi:hypothetical protein
MSVDLRPENPARRALPRCPRCRSQNLTPVTADERVNFLCNVCGRCWSVEFNWVQRVDPATCPGCDHRDRCTDIYLADHPDAASAMR